MKYLFWINGWLTLQVVYFIPELIWMIDFSYHEFKQAFFIFHNKHYKLYFSYQRWYESLMYPLWIITRGHFCRFCVNDNTYTVRTHEPVIYLKPLCLEFIMGHPNGFSENAWRSCCSFQKRMSLSKVSLQCMQVHTPGVSQVCTPAYFECVIYT